MAKRISQRTQEALNVAGRVCPLLRELILFAAQNPGLSRYDFSDETQFQRTSQAISAQWQEFLAVLRYAQLSRVTSKKLIAAGNEILQWSETEGRWKLTQKLSDTEAALAYRAEALNLLLRALKG